MTERLAQGGDPGDELGDVAQPTQLDAGRSLRGPVLAEQPRLLTLRDVANLLRVSPKTVRRLMRRGLPCIRVGRSVRFAPRAVSRWLEARQEGG